MVAYVDKREGDTYLREYLNKLKWILDNEDVAPLREMTMELGFQLAGLLILISSSMGSVKAVGEWLQSLTGTSEYGTTAGQILGIFVGATTKKERILAAPRRCKDVVGKIKKMTVLESSSVISQLLPNLRKAIKALALVVSVLNAIGKVATTVEIKFIKLKLKKVILRLREAKGMNSEVSDCTVLNMKRIYKWNPDAMKKTSWARVFCSGDALKKQSGRVLTMGASEPFTFFQGFDL